MVWMVVLVLVVLVEQVPAPAGALELEQQNQVLPGSLAGSLCQERNKQVR